MSSFAHSIFRSELDAAWLPQAPVDTLAVLLNELVHVNGPTGHLSIPMDIGF